MHDFETSLGNVLLLPAARSRPPQYERRWREFASHDGNADSHPTHE